MWIVICRDQRIFTPKLWKYIHCELGFPGGSVLKNLPASAGDMGLFPGLGRSLEEEMAMHCSILAWKIPQTEEPQWLQSIGLQRVRNDRTHTRVLWITKIVLPNMKNFMPIILQFSSVQSLSHVPTLCDPINRSTPGLPVHHQFPEFTQPHVHRVSDAIQPSHPLSSPSPPVPNPSQHQSLFQWVNSSHEVAKVLEFQL